MNTIIIAIVWFLGFLVSFVMQRTEIAAEKEPYTFGDRLLITAMSILSWAWVVVILISTWIKSISKTGYWDQEIEKEQPAVIIENATIKQK